MAREPTYEQLTRTVRRLEREAVAHRSVQEALRLRAEELATLNALGRTVGASLSLDDTVVAILEGMLLASRPDVAFLFLRDGDRLVLGSALPAAGRQRLGAILEHRVGECMCGLAVREGRPLFSRDIFVDPRCTWVECKKAGFKSFAALPLRNGDEVIAVIGLAAQAERDFEQQASFLETLAGQMSVALANARLFDLARRELADRTRAEEEKERLQAQLLQAQKLESVGRLAGGVAHDFNNMLGVVVGNADLAMHATGPGETVYHHLKEIADAARRSAHLVRQLLAFARKQAARPVVLDLNETVSSMTTMLRRLIGEDVELIWAPGCGVWPVRIDPSQIDQVLANLSVNARDAISGVGKLTIETANVSLDPAYCAEHVGASPGDYVAITVSDTGAGMGKEVLQRLFEPFFTTKELGRGTGLGLATVYGIVKQNHGTITVDSEPGRGTTIRVCLPRWAGEVAAAGHHAPAAKPPTGTETVLLAEDDGALLEVIRDILQRIGYTVLPARTPTEALALAARHEGPIHLLITDVVMPEMNGRELLERLIAVRPGTKGLFMSGHTADMVIHQGVPDETARFIQKPFSLVALAEKIREILNRRAP